MRPAISLIVSIGLKSVSYLSNCPSFEALTSCAAAPAPACTTPMYNQSYHGEIIRLIATMMDTFLDTAQNDSNGGAVRYRVSTCASLCEVCGNKHTTEKQEKT